MNYDNTFRIEIPGDSKQIDILAVDDETILIIECKASQQIDKSTSFKKELESIKGYLPDVIKELIQHYPGRKIKHIFATKNYILGQSDLDRIKEMNSFYFNYDTVLYYRDLTNHLDAAAKYQLLGNIFQKTKIENLETKVLALKGNMGGLDYYTFLIEPEKLLRLAYILHRNNANISNFPTYQRLIKKDRLKSVREFINQGGYFPNSLICSIDGNVKFEQSPQKINGAISSAGVLTLPQTYMSMYVIDGQHRLYGYSESRYANNNVVPVVAFLNMAKEDQVKMFMDINEHQKPVSKTLRNTLNADLLWESDIPKQRQEALAVKIAEALGEDQDSPLFNRVLSGEETKTDIRCITTEVIKNAIKDSNFLNKYDKNIIKTNGTFDRNDNNVTYPILASFLKESLELVRSYNAEEWNKGSEGYLAINNTIYAFIRIVSDIVDIHTNGLTDVSIISRIRPMLIEFSQMISSLGVDTLKSLKLYGDGGKKIAWRTLQVCFNSKEPIFTNADLETYIDQNSTRNNEEAENKLNDIDNYINGKFKEKYSEKDIANLSQTVIRKMMEYESSKRIENLNMDIDETIDVWKAVSFDEYINLARAIPADEIVSLLSTDSFENTKVAIIDWLTVLSSSSKKVKDNKAVVQKDFDLIKSIHSVK